MCVCVCVCVCMLQLNLNLKILSSNHNISLMIHGVEMRGEEREVKERVLSGGGFGGWRKWERGW